MQIYAWNAGVLNYWLIITFYRTREAIDAAMTYWREKLGLATLKPKQETAISDFALGKVKITGSWCFLNRCEESDDLGSQGSLMQMKQGCRAIDRSTHATPNTRKQTNSYLVETIFLLNLTEMMSRVNELTTFQRSALPPVKSPDPPSPREILEAIRARVVWVWERD